MEPVACPNIDKISCNKDEFNLFLGPAPSYVSIVSSSFSCIGALSIIITYCTFVQLRTPTRSIITFLAIADLVTALGYILGAINYLIYYNNEPQQGCNIFQILCSLQSFITIWSQTSSYLWNCFLALFLYVMIVHSKHSIAHPMITVFHLFAWVVPICVAMPLLSLDFLGYSPYISSNWCFIRDRSYLIKRTLLRKELLLTLFIGEIPELLTFTILIFFYAITRYHIRKRMRLNLDSLLLNSIRRIDHRLLIIPLVYVVLKMWGPIQYFFAIIISHHWDRGCLSGPVHYTHLTLALIEAVGEGGQGWANALIFVFMNSRTRTLVLEKLLNCCRRRYRHREILKGLDASESRYCSTISARHTTLNQVSGDTNNNDNSFE